MELWEIREKIDDIDHELLRLFLERMALSREAWQAKEKSGLPARDADREREILARAARYSGPMAPYSEKLFDYIMYLSREYQRNNAAAEELPKDDLRNIVLIGMPGCGKSTVGMCLAELTGRRVISVDNEIERAAGKTIPEIFAESGEAGFRVLEREETAKAASRSGVIIATGGGVVKTPENYGVLSKNGRIYYLRRPIKELEMDGRPLSKSREALELMYLERNPLYMSFADHVIPEGWTPNGAALEIINDFRGSGKNRTNK